MTCLGNGNRSNGIEESSGSKVMNQIPLHISTSHNELKSNENPENWCLGSFASLSKRPRFFKFSSLNSPLAKLQQLAKERDEISLAAQSSSSHGVNECFNRIFSQKIDWVSPWKICREWMKNPMNLALFLWITCVAVSGAILFLVMTGMLNDSLPKKSQRDAWFEVNNQILNALFTLMCLYQHPKRLYHLALLLRWKQEDISKLRKIYCKNGTYKPHEWAHMMVVVVLLHINCFAQYALCGLNLGYKRAERPAIGVGVCISVAIVAPAIAGVYSILSPLWKEYDTEVDGEAQIEVTAAQNCRSGQFRLKSFEKRLSFASCDRGRMIENTPQWSGGILDFWDDISLACLSLFCSFCVFGWNMERLGFGNMYVHVATFLLFCMAPFWIFNFAAINIDNEAVREALGIIGVFLCFFGLLYGGFWRIQMRKRFNLPPYKFCCCKPAVTDCALWLFCCWFSLAQEVRTGNAYDIVEDMFYKKQVDECGQSPVSRSPCEDGDFQFRKGSTSSLGKSSSPSQTMKVNFSSPSRCQTDFHSCGRKLPLVEEKSSGRVKEETMAPPAPSRIQR